jgi:hypothetical protein
MLPDMSTRFGATAYLPTTKARCRTQRKTEFSRDIIRGSSVSHRADDRQASDLLTEALSVIQVGWE